MNTVALVGEQVILNCSIPKTMIYPPHWGRGDRFNNIFQGKFIYAIFQDRGFYVEKYIDEQKKGFDLVITNGTLQLNDSNTYSCFHFDADTERRSLAKAHVVVLGNYIYLLHSFKN